MGNPQAGFREGGLLGIDARFEQHGPPLWNRIESLVDVSEWRRESPFPFAPGRHVTRTARSVHVANVSQITVAQMIPLSDLRLYIGIVGGDAAAVWI